MKKNLSTEKIKKLIEKDERYAVVFAIYMVFLKTRENESELKKNSFQALFASFNKQQKKMFEKGLGELLAHKIVEEWELILFALEYADFKFDCDIR